jgi:HlyD family secretion protein
MNAPLPPASLSLPAGLPMDRVRRPTWRVRLRRVAGRAALVVLAGGSAAGLVFSLAAARGLAVKRADLTIATATRGTFEDELALRATVVPAHSVLLDAVDGGRVEAVPVADGASVHAGELLVRLSNPQREQDVLARTADVAQQLSNLSVQRSALAADRAALRRDLASLDAEAGRAGREAARTRELARQGFVSPAALEEAEARLALQQRLVAQAREDGESEQAIRAQSVRELEAAVQGLQAGLRLVHDAAAGLAVRAPIAGRLAGFSLQQGATVRPGDHLGRIDGADGFRLQAAIDEFHRERVRAGLVARLEIEGAAYAMTVARVDPQIVQGRFGVELAFAGAAPPALQAGQGVDARIVLGRPASALLLDDGPFRVETGGTSAWVLSADGSHAERRALRIGRRSGATLEVLEGLQPGERVIVSSGRGFADATRLRVQP